MDYVKIALAITDDLKRVARSCPNEKLPKEEQIRSRIFAELLDEYEFVCVERGYSAHAGKNGAEVDIWAKSNVGTEYWMELKRCWCVSGSEWVNKAGEQQQYWQDDVNKLAVVSCKDVRTFVLIGCFDADPLGKSNAIQAGVVRKIVEFYPNNLRFCTSEPFAWRQTKISHLGVWIWDWRSDENIVC